mmetsp:Transcript_6400/g.25872  ORF Transcript_6400/g.25872 Transcript_6400/m.25872 type:complete len:212 (+) Transcript_6400:2987-3622(+)
MLLQTRSSASPALSCCFGKEPVSEAPRTIRRSPAEAQKRRATSRRPLPPSLPGCRTRATRRAGRGASRARACLGWRFCACVTSTCCLWSLQCLQSMRTSMCCLSARCRRRWSSSKLRARTCRALWPRPFLRGLCLRRRSPPRSKPAVTSSPRPRQATERKRTRRRMARTRTRRRMARTTRKLRARRADPMRPPHCLRRHKNTSRSCARRWR